MIRPVNLKIFQDWSNLLKLFDGLDTRWKNNQLANGVFVEESGDYHWHIGKTGCFTSLNCVTVQPMSAAILSGDIVDKHCSWLDKFKQDFAPLHINNTNVMGMVGDITPHIDRIPDYNGPHCRINIMINDTSSVTYAQNQDCIESYPGQQNTAWLLDTTKMHWVASSKLRYVFQINFFESFDTVSAWLDQHPDLVYCT